ncbi:Acyltransferase family protein [Rubripirellula tenax]|uniref:Acyltransferase family protein n=1 Tax=Rubripirellula tenax TaxID=2528015 RepID=A0A5C6FIK7_9BACT|nr:acyltransferase [Rubripirellula tenax]TWU59491.1 Acyltransferase family protein [Rubripirellula tenax]
MKNQHTNTVSSSSDSSRRFFGSLESVRFICAATVAFFHATWVSHVTYLRPFQNAWVLVDFFFVLSGFVIFNAYGRMDRSLGSSVSFVIKRIFRLYPLHFATLLGVGVIQFIAWKFLGKEDPFGGDWLYLLTLNLTMSHAIGLAEQPILNIPSWSISTEFYAYLVFLFACILARTAMIRMLILASLACVGFVAMRVYHQEYGLLLPVTASLARCIFSFGLGVLTFSVFDKHNDGWSALTSTIVLCCCFIFSVVMMASCDPKSAYLLSMPFCFAMSIYALVKDSGSWISRALEAKWLLYMGKRSYSIYLNHVMVLMLVSFAVSQFSKGKIDVGHLQSLHQINVWAGDACLLVYLISLTLVSVITYRWIEEPGRLKGKKFADAAKRFLG